MSQEGILSSSEHFGKERSVVSLPRFEPWINQLVPCTLLQ